MSYSTEVFTSSFGARTGFSFSETLGILLTIVAVELFYYYYYCAITEPTLPLLIDLTVI